MPELTHHEILQLRQTVAMLPPQSDATVSRELVLRLIGEVERLRER